MNQYQSNPLTKIKRLGILIRTIKYSLINGGIWMVLIDSN